MNVRSISTKEQIVENTIPILAAGGYAGTSMRKVATAVGKEPSIIYAHFADKDALLRAVRLHVITYLDGAQHYTDGADAALLLRETLHFQFEHRMKIVALLQYFMAMRGDFPLVEGGGYIPSRAYAHMRRVIENGVSEGVYHSDNIDFDAKITVHLVNGFLMEYFDKVLKKTETERLVEQLAGFIERALRKEV